jgi:hypothetical protein
MRVTHAWQYLDTVNPVALVKPSGFTQYTAQRSLYSLPPLQGYTATHGSGFHTKKKFNFCIDPIHLVIYSEKKFI